MGGSIACFLLVLGVLVGLDPRVRERAWILAGEASGSGGDRLAELGDAVLLAIRDQSIEHAPLLIFSIVAAVLLIFMLRT